MRSDCFVHPSAFVDEPCTIGAGTKIWHFCQIIAGRYIYNQFVIRPAQRDSLMAHLKAYQISHEVYYPELLHQQECFANLGHRAGDFPASEQAAQETLALPIYPELSEAIPQVVVDAVAAHPASALVH
jgi:dTDP-4-amino-4,6-dideoxygalactose transaminase